MARRALVTGVSGQDGSYLSEFLLAKGYEVHGLVRRWPGGTDGGAPRPVPDARVRLHEGDLLDRAALEAVFDRCRPDEVYNLGALSQVGMSFEHPLDTADVDALGALRLLEIIRAYQKDSKAAPVRFYQAGSSEMYGKILESPQNEATPFNPRSPYAVAKVFAFWQTLNHREYFGLHASNGILFNHESPRRPETFVTRKITRAAARIKLGLQDKLVLGNLDSRRDWGFAGDYVEAMWLMLQQEQSGDYVVATGQMHSVGQFLDEVFGRLGLDRKRHVEQDSRYFRPADVEQVRGNAGKALKVLGWKPKIGFKELAAMMADADMELARRELQAREASGGGEGAHRP